MPPPLGAEVVLIIEFIKFVVKQVEMLHDVKLLLRRERSHQGLPGEGVGLTQAHQSRREPLAPVFCSHSITHLRIVNNSSITSVKSMPRRARAILSNEFVMRLTTASAW